MLGLDVLGQLGYQDGRPWLEQNLPVAIGASRDPVPLVVEAAVSALGHLGDPRGLEAVLDCLRHSDEEVRWAVAAAIPWVLEILLVIVRYGP